MYHFIFKDATCSFLEFGRPKTLDTMLIWKSWSGRIPTLMDGHKTYKQFSSFTTLRPVVGRSLTVSCYLNFFSILLTVDWLLSRYFTLKIRQTLWCVRVLLPQFIIKISIFTCRNDWHHVWHNIIYLNHINVLFWFKFLNSIQS